jgi:hypothetical protein
MQKNYHGPRPSQPVRGTDSQPAKGFRPLALPAVVAAAKAIARRPVLRDPAPRERPERDDS